MKEMLLITAILNRDMLLDCGELNILADYLPMDLQRAFQKSPVILKGFGICFESFVKLLESNQVPTVERIKTVSRTSTLGSQHVLDMLSSGGKVEHVLETAFSVAEKVQAEKVGDWEYEDYEEQIEAHPTTPFDDAFDIGFYMCVNNGGGNLAQRGPYRRYFSDDEDDDY